MNAVTPSPTPTSPTDTYWHRTPMFPDEGYIPQAEVDRRTQLEHPELIARPAPTVGKDAIMKAAIMNATMKSTAVEDSVYRYFDPNWSSAKLAVPDSYTEAFSAGQYPWETIVQELQGGRSPEDVFNSLDNKEDVTVDDVVGMRNEMAKWGLIP